MRRTLVLAALLLPACGAPSSAGDPDDGDEAPRKPKPEVAKKTSDPPTRAKPSADPPGPKSTPPASLPSATEQGVVLAKLPGDPPRLLRSGTPTTAAAIEAALPGFRVKPRSSFGVDVLHKSRPVAAILEEVGKPFNRIILLGPGLSDSHGVEVGAPVSALAGIPELECAIDGDEQWGIYVACSAGAKPQVRYVFAMQLPSERMGEALTLSAAEQELGETRLTAIEIAVW